MSRRLCIKCKIRPVVGNAKKRYCNSYCKQMAYFRRKAVAFAESYIERKGLAVSKAGNEKAKVMPYTVRRVGNETVIEYND